MRGFGRGPKGLCCRSLEVFVLLLSPRNIASCTVIIFVMITNIIRPEYFLCNAVATGVCLFAREHVKEFALLRDKLAM